MGNLERAALWLREHPEVLSAPDTVLRAAQSKFSLTTLDVLTALRTALEPDPEAYAQSTVLQRQDQKDIWPPASHTPAAEYVVDASSPKVGNTGTVTIGRYTFPRLGLGCMRLVTGSYCVDDEWFDATMLPPDPEKHRHYVLDAVHACGIRYVDIAHGYGPWASAGDSLLKDWLAPFPPDLLYATKVGYGRTEDAYWFIDRSPAIVRADIEACHDALGGKIPLVFLVARSTAEVPVQNPCSLAESMGPMLEAQRAGLIEHIGIANVTAEEIRKMCDVADIVAVQNKFMLPYLHDESAREPLSVCQERNIPFVAWGIFGEDEWPRPEPDPKLAAEAAALSISHQELTIALLLHAAPNLVALPGASRTKTIHSSVRASAVSLSPNILSRFGIHA